MAPLPFLWLSLFHLHFSCLLILMFAQLKSFLWLCHHNVRHFRVQCRHSNQWVHLNFRQYLDLAFDQGALQETCWVGSLPLAWSGPLVTPVSSAIPLLTLNQHITLRHHSILSLTPKTPSFSPVWLPSKLVPYQMPQPSFNQDIHYPPRNITSSKVLILTITSPWSIDSANASLNTLCYCVILCQQLLPIQGHRQKTFQGG